MTFPLAFRPDESGELFLPFPSTPGRLGSASAARSTLVTSSIQALRARGLRKRYEELLPAGPREVLVGAVAGTWLPIEAARAHYQACDALELDPGEQMEIAVEVGERVHGTFLGFVLRMARSAGVTPWTALAHSGKLYDRLFCGGGLSIVRRGPKDAQVDLVGNQLCAIDYFRLGVCGVFQSALRLFCRRIVAHDLPVGRPIDSMSLRLAWV